MRITTKKKPQNEDTLAEAAFQILARNCTGPFYQDLASITSFPSTPFVILLTSCIRSLVSYTSIYSSFDTSIAQPIVF